MASFLPDPQAITFNFKKTYKCIITIFELKSPGGIIPES